MATTPLEHLDVQTNQDWINNKTQINVHNHHGCGNALCE
jgi:hypothetical protein